MKRLKKYYRKAVPALAIFALVILFFAIARAVNWHRFRAAEANPQWNSAAETLPVLIWKELKSLFVFNRFA